MEAHPSAVQLFCADTFRAIALHPGDVPQLQRFFDLNPDYFLAVSGQAPSSREAHDEIHGTLPEGWPFTKKWIIGFLDERDSLIAMANVVSDLLAPGVWHIGLFILATRLHGGGAAYALYAHLEAWTRGLGAQWLRLGVVKGNARAERFWEKLGFVEVRQRESVEMGTLVNTVRVMAKPLAGGTIDQYLATVARDRSE
jgi:GNAT superfamily N-acetyltransferase